MYAAKMKWLGRSMSRSSAICRRGRTKRDAVLERLEDRVVLLGALNGDVLSSHKSDLGHGLAKKISAAVHSVVGPDAKEPDAGAVNLQSCSFCAAYLQRHAEHDDFADAWRVCLSFTDGIPGLDRRALNTTTRGVLQYNYPSTNGLFSYTATTTGTDQFTYYVTSSNGQTSNTATVTITNTCSTGLVLIYPITITFEHVGASTPRDSTSIIPKSGRSWGLKPRIPATATTIVSVNKHFNVASARSAHAENPGQYDQEQPILVAFFTSRNPRAAIQACCRTPLISRNSSLSMMLTPRGIRWGTCTWGRSSRSRTSSRRGARSCRRRRLAAAEWSTSTPGDWKAHGLCGSAVRRGGSHFPLHQRPRFSSAEKK